MTILSIWITIKYNINRYYQDRTVDKPLFSTDKNCINQLDPTINHGLLLYYI